MSNQLLAVQTQAIQLIPCILCPPLSSEKSISFSEPTSPQLPLPEWRQLQPLQTTV